MEMIIKTTFCDFCSTQKKRVKHTEFLHFTIEYIIKKLVAKYIEQAMDLFSTGASRWVLRNAKSSIYWG
jgi:hypothetical protein